MHFPTIKALGKRRTSWFCESHVADFSPIKHILPRLRRFCEKSTPHRDVFVSRSKYTLIKESRCHQSCTMLRLTAVLLSGRLEDARDASAKTRSEAQVHKTKAFSPFVWKENDRCGRDSTLPVHCAAGDGVDISCPLRNRLRSGEESLAALAACDGSGSRRV